METDLCKFYEHIKQTNKTFTVYEDEEKGIKLAMNTISILPRLEYFEVDKTTYEKLKFEQKIEDLEYNIIEIDKPTIKSEITGKEKDKNTIVNSKVAMRQIWNVNIQAGASKCFVNKEDAKLFFDGYFDKIFKIINEEI